MKTTFFASLTFLFLVIIACERPEEMPNSDKGKFVESYVVASNGATIETSDSIKLEIPANAIPEDGIVRVGRTGLESSDIPNHNFKLATQPITFEISTDRINESLKISFPKPASNVTVDNYFVFLYDGDTYFPVEYSLVDGRVIVSIDVINWNSNIQMKSSPISSFIILGLIWQQTPPSEEMGLKKVSLNQNGDLTFFPTSAHSGSRILLLIHGWIGRPTIWDSIVNWTLKDQRLNYDEIWTYGYNSSFSIQTNAENLLGLLETASNSAEIDIIAHSMGGLVARSMIEQFNGNQYIHKLVTLGTPHFGSPLAALRYYLGSFVKVDTPLDPFSDMVYNYFTQGFKDLYPGSLFIQQLTSLIQPPLQYYSIAVENNDSYIGSNENILPGKDDGIVQVSSALGVSAAIKPEVLIKLNIGLAHTKMTRDKNIYEQIIPYLAESLVKMPVAKFNATPTNVSLYQKVQFTDQSDNNPTSWNWDFGDGSNSTEKNPSHAYNSIGEYTVRLTVSNSVGSNSLSKSGYISVSFGDLSSGLISYWKIDEISGSIVTDSHGENNCTVQTGVTLNQQGLLGEAASFSGTSGGLTTGKKASQLGIDGGKSKSVSLWIKPDQSLNGLNSCGIIDLGSHSNQQQFGIKFYGAPAFWMFDSWYGSVRIGKDNDKLADGFWHHIVVTYNSDNHNITTYLDGNLVTEDNSKTLNTGDSNGFSIGIGSQGKFIGLIDEVGLWNRALTQNDISNLYNNGKGLSYPF